MTKLDETIKRLIAEKDQKDSTVRFNITLSKDQNRRAEYVAKVLNRPKQSVVEELFTSALHDLETQLGLWKQADSYLARIESDAPISELINLDWEE
jgi:hypothetical protein